jgi:hypothetical protein
METFDPRSLWESLRNACGGYTDKDFRTDTHRVVVEVSCLKAVLANHNNGNEVVSTERGFPLRGGEGLARFLPISWVC